jgi:hypothetical protein
VEWSGQSLGSKNRFRGPKLPAIYEKITLFEVKRFRWGPLFVFLAIRGRYVCKKKLTDIGSVKIGKMPDFYELKDIGAVIWDKTLGEKPVLAK